MCYLWKVGWRYGAETLQWVLEVGLWFDLCGGGIGEVDGACRSRLELGCQLRAGVNLAEYSVRSFR